MEETTIKFNDDEVFYIFNSLQSDIETHILYQLDSDYEGFFKKLNGYINIYFKFHSHGLISKGIIANLDVINFFKKSLESCLNKDLEIILVTLEQLVGIIPDLEKTIKNIKNKIKLLNF